MQSEQALYKNSLIIHPVSKADEHCRNLYFDMLCAAAITDKENFDKTGRFIQKLITVCTGTNDYAEHLKHAFEMTDKDIMEFILQCRQNELCEIFLTDTMIMACLNGKPEKTIMKFIADMAEALGIEKDKFQNIIKIIRAILDCKINFNICFDSLRKIDDYNLIKKLDCYISMIEKIFMIQKEKLGEKYITSVAKKIWDNNLAINSPNYKLMVIENQIFDSAKITIKNVEKVIIKNCTFKNTFESKKTQVNYGIGFINVKVVIIEGSRFSDMNRAIEFRDCQMDSQVNIKNCFFSYCKSFDDNGIITANDCRIILNFFDCRFSDCNAVQKYSYCNAYCISQMTSGLYNCKLTKCAEDNNEMYLFHRAYFDDCTIVKCCQQAYLLCKSKKDLTNNI